MDIVLQNAGVVGRWCQCIDFFDETVKFTLKRRTTESYVLELSPGSLLTSAYITIEYEADSNADIVSGDAAATEVGDDSVRPAKRPAFEFYQIAWCVNAAYFKRVLSAFEPDDFLTVHLDGGGGFMELSQGTVTSAIQTCSRIPVVHDLSPKLVVTAGPSTLYCISDIKEFKSLCESVGTSDHPSCSLNLELGPADTLYLRLRTPDVSSSLRLGVCTPSSSNLLDGESRTYSILSDALIAFCKLFWRKGSQQQQLLFFGMDHNDVAFFRHEWKNHRGHCTSTMYF